jgi:uncharacterized repeat protein (TIGR03803 family)
MTKLYGWKTGCAVFVMAAATALAASAQTFKTLVQFDGTNGLGPGLMNLVQGHDGNLYGTTFRGGTQNMGTVFKIGPFGKMTTLYSFCSLHQCADGYYPSAGLASAVEGVLYGVTSAGGVNDGGTLFKITSEGKLTTLYNFCSKLNCDDGSDPEALVQGTDGNLYGTTQAGGASYPYDCGNGCGTVFKITPQGELTTLHSFGGLDGAYPAGTLIQATDGKFYGTAGSFGNDQISGTVFTITSNGTFATLYNFDDSYYTGSDLGGLIQALDGNFYGTTASGGSGLDCSDGGPCGTVFRLTPEGDLTTIYNFCTLRGCPDGALPFDRLVQATDGNFYGSTHGGTYDNGTIFKITPDGNLTTLHSFCAKSGCPDGTRPEGGLTQSTDGALYGTTSLGGGSQDAGTVFGFNIGLSPFITFVVSAGKVGQTGGILGQGLTGTTGVSLNGIPASFTVVSDTFIKATVPAGATTGYVTVTTPSGPLTSNVPFHVIP